MTNSLHAFVYQLFHDERTGKTYLSYATYADDSEYDRPKGMVPISSFICEIDLSTGRQKTPSKLLRYSKAGSGVCEGPHLFRTDDYVYLSTAEGGTELGHQQWICRTKDEDLCNAKWEIGPDPDINPLIFNKDHPEVQQTGHMDIVEGSDGRWWAVFLGVRPVYENNERLGSPLGRETFLAPLEWNSDGWPVVNQRQPISVEGLSGVNLARSSKNFEVQLPMEPGRGQFALIITVERYADFSI
jgi:beta-xylosidase